MIHMGKKLFLFILTFLSFWASYAQSLPPLLKAIKANNISEVSRLIENGSNLTVADNDSDQVLMYAALYASDDCIQLLLEKGANPNAKNKLGETALLWSVHDLKRVRLLIQYGADVNVVTDQGNTPLLAACVGSMQSEVIRLLLDKGANPLAKNSRGETSLMRVALYGDTATAALLINRGVDVNLKNSNQETALFMCARTANNQMVSWLLRNGADADCLDSYKATALSYAVVVCDMPAIEALIKKTKNINLLDVDGMSFLMWAAYSETDRPQIVQLLLDNGALPRVKNEKGQTALSWASKKGNTKTVELLNKYVGLK
jgi:ankyrin repeat protein